MTIMWKKNYLTSLYTPEFKVQINLGIHKCAKNLFCTSAVNYVSSSIVTSITDHFLKQSFIWQYCMLKWTVKIFEIIWFQNDTEFTADCNGKEKWNVFLRDLNFIF